MKKLLYLFLILFSLLINAQGINFEKDTFKNILAKAKKENKLVFLDAYTSWCGPCKMLERNVFSQKEVGDYYNANFLNAHFDMEKGEGINLAQKYSVYSYPSLLFINGDGVVVYRTAGYLDPKDFISLGKTAINPENKLENKVLKFNAGEKDPEFLIDLIKSTYNNDFSFAKKVSERYFQNKKSGEITKDDAGMLLYFTKSTEDFNYGYLQQNKTDILRFLSEKVLNDFEKQIKLTTVIQKSIDEENHRIDNDFLNTELIKILGEKEGKQLASKIRLDYYFRTQNYEEYQKAAAEYYQDPTPFDANELNDIAWNFYLYVNDNNALQNAVKWCLESVKKQEDSFNTDTLARIYFKMGDMKNAKIWAEKSIAVAKSKNAEYKSTEELLKNIK